MNDAVTEQLFTNIVRDLGTGNALLREALSIFSADPDLHPVADRKIRQASENIVNTIANVQALAKRVTVDA